jgi:hypothetical protein
MADSAKGAALVALVTAEPNATLSRRVRAQLEGLGVDVIVLRPPAEGSAARAPLEQAARSVGAIAAVRLVISGEGRIEVWVADRVTGKAVVRELDAHATEASEAAIAIDTVELLRASLMEIHSSEPPPGEVAVTPKLRALALPETPALGAPRLGVSIAAGGTLGGAWLGPSLDAEIVGWLGIAGRWGVRVVGRSSLVAAHVTSESGAIDVQSQLLGGLVSYDFAAATATWVPTVGLGFAGVHVSSVGSAVPPFVSAAESAWRPAPLLGAGLAWSVAHGLRLCADVRGFWVFPSVEIRTPTQNLGQWSAPAISLSLGLEVLWGT